MSRADRCDIDQRRPFPNRTAPARSGRSAVLSGADLIQWRHQGRDAPQERSLQLEALEVGPELRRQLRSLERKLDRRLKPAHRRPAVVARALELVAVDGLLL